MPATPFSLFSVSFWKYTRLLPPLADSPPFFSRSQTAHKSFLIHAWSKVFQTTPRRNAARPYLPPLVCFHPERNFLTPCAGPGLRVPSLDTRHQRTVFSRHFPHGPPRFRQFLADFFDFRPTRPARGFWERWPNRQLCSLLSQRTSPPPLPCQPLPGVTSSSPPPPISATGRCFASPLFPLPLPLSRN